MQTVIITGGSSGIGLDLAKHYAQAGFHVGILARNQQRIDEALSSINLLKKNSVQKIMGFSVDVGNAQQLTATVDAVKQEFVCPDILILSAGIVQSIEFMQQSDEDFANIMHTNVMGSRAVANAFLPDMVANQKGQLCFVSSLGGLIATYGYSAYSASKFAVIGMAGALRQELHKHKVGVSVLCPPEVDTPMVVAESAHILKETRFVKDIGGTLNVKTVTKATVKGIAKNQFIIVPGIMAKISYAQARFMPRVFGYFMQVLVNISGKFIK